MNNAPDENGVKYVVAMPPTMRQVNIRKVNIKDLPPAAIARLIQSKKVGAAGDSAMTSDTARSEANNSDDVELTVVSNSQDANKTLNAVRRENYSSEPAAKKFRVEISAPVTNHTSKETELEPDQGSEVLGKDDVDDDYEGLEEDIEEDYEVTFSNAYVSSSMKGNVQSDVRKRFTAKDDEYYYSADNSYRAKRTQASSDSDKRKFKPKLFRSEWLEIDIFRDWLDRDPSNPSKARCTACNTIMNAGKSELEKHATGARHCQNLQIMQQQQLLMYQTQWKDEEDVISNVETTMVDGEGEQITFGESGQEQCKDEQLAVLNRLATSLDTLTSSISVVMEKLSSNQETLLQILQQLIPK